jgi:GNAT superfamily N-acetyltransferase
MEFRLRKLAFPQDEIWMTGDGAAAAVWVPPPGRGQESRWQRLRLLPPLIRFLGWRTASVLGGLNRMEERHPHDPSHWYLFILGTEQAAQGQGLGSALLAPCSPALTPTGCLPTWSRRTSGTSPSTAATASR